MPLKMFLAVAAAMAVLVGLILPVPHRTEAQATPQLQTIEIGRG